MNAPIIGLDYTPAYEQGGGIGRYVRELIAALAEQDRETDYRLFIARGKLTKPLPTPPGSNFKLRVARFSPKWFARFWHRLRVPVPIEQWIGPVSLYHATDFVLPPTRPATRTLLTVHDLSFVRVPDSASPRLKRYLDQVVPRSVRRANHVLADSQATKDDLVALYGVSPDKISVLLSGVHPRFRRTDQDAQHRVRAKYKVGDVPFVLAVGTVQPRKNYERLMQALAALPAELADVQLMIVGGKGWLDDPIYAAVKALGLADRVHFTGFADDADLPALYSAARAVAFPSLYEGFGLPILEGMACGTPVLTAKVSSLIEVAGSAAVLVDPLSVADIAQGLRELLSNERLRAELIEGGYRQAAQFTWERAAQQLRGHYRALLERAR